MHLDTRYWKWNYENFLLEMYKLNGRNEWRCNVAPSKNKCKKLIEARWAGDDQQMTHRCQVSSGPPPSLPSHLSQYRIQLILKHVGSLSQSTYHLSYTKSRRKSLRYSDIHWWILFSIIITWPQTSFYSVRCAVVTIVWAAHWSWTHQMRLWELTQIPASASAGCCTGSSVRDNLWSL